MNKCILFVDDEKQILKAIKRLFMKTDYNVFFAEGGKEALDILKNNEINILVTDMRMPEMGGYELLERVKALYPDTLRLILSGYADENQVFKAINNNLARVYIYKPWDNDNFLKLIQQMFEFEEAFKNKNVLNVIQRIEKLPTLPKIYSKFCSLIDEEATLDRISAVIEEDQSISAAVLKVANSSFYSINAGSIKQAASYLGLNNIKNIVFVSSIFNLNDIGDKFKLDILWKHAILSNKILHLIFNKLLNKKISDHSSTSGLLHDIGKIVEIQYFPREYEQIMSIVNSNPSMIPLEVEKEILNTTHADIGAYLLNWWGVPHPIIESALYHHIPLDERVVNKELVCAVHISDYYSWRLLDEPAPNDFQTGTLNYLGISKEACENLLLEIDIPVLGSDRNG